MKKKILISSIVFLLVVLNFSFYFYFISKINSSNKIIKQNEEIINKCKNENNLESKEDEKENNYNCTYTETFQVIDNYDYNGTVPTDAFVIVDKFQKYSPKILRYNKNDFNFEKGKNY